MSFDKAILDMYIVVMYVDTSVYSNFIESNQRLQDDIKSLLKCNRSRSGKSFYCCTKLSIHLNVKWWVNWFFCILLPSLGEGNLIRIMVSSWNVDRWVTVSADVEMLPIHKHVFCTIHRRKLTTYIMYYQYWVVNDWFCDS